MSPKAGEQFEYKILLICTKCTLERNTRRRYICIILHNTCQLVGNLRYAATVAFVHVCCSTTEPICAAPFHQRWGFASFHITQPDDRRL